MTADNAARAEKLKGSGKKLITLTFLVPKVLEKWTANQHKFDDDITKGKTNKDGLEGHRVPDLQAEPRKLVHRKEPAVVIFQSVKEFFEECVHVITVDCSQMETGPADPDVMEQLGEYSPAYKRKYTDAKSQKY